MQVCGVDPGLRVTGYAIVESQKKKLRIIDAGVIRANRSEELSVRLQQIYSDLCDLLQSVAPSVLAVENVYSHTKHPLTSVMMGHVRGVLLLAAAQHQIPVCEYAATQIKKSITGNGQAAKSQIQQAVKMVFGMAEPPSPHDVADALAIALCHTRSEHMAETAPGCGVRLR